MQQRRGGVVVTRNLKAKSMQKKKLELKLAQQRLWHFSCIYFIIIIISVHDYVQAECVCVRLCVLLLMKNIQACQGREAELQAEAEEQWQRWRQRQSSCRRRRWGLFCAQFMARSVTFGW